MSNLAAWGITPLEPPPPPTFQLTQLSTFLHIEQ